MRTESETVSTTPVHVTTQAETVATATNTATGAVNNSVKLVAAVIALTPAQRYVSRRNNCTIAGRHCTSGVSGQKSSANRAISGRPMTTDAARKTAVTTVRMIGWRKYTTSLSLSMKIVVRTEIPDCGEHEQPGDRACRSRSRRATAV